jgi:hypothetical protein
MRIKTSGAKREVDRWKDVVSRRYARFAASLYFLLIAVGHKRQLFLPVLLTVGMSLHFAVAELASLVVLGLLLLRLHSYRFANLVLNSFARVR